MFRRYDQGMYSDSSTAILGIVIPLVALAISLAVLYGIVQSAVVGALRRARREAWTETYMPEKADWLTVRQREELAEKLHGKPDAEGGV